MSKRLGCLLQYATTESEPTHSNCSGERLAPASRKASREVRKESERARDEKKKRHGKGRKKDTRLTSVKGNYMLLKRRR